MKYNNHILLKAISDPVNSYTRIELHNVPKAPLIQRLHYQST